MWEGPNKDLAAPANGRPKRNATAYADYAVDSGDMESDDGDNKGGGGHGTRGTGKTKRNAKQQVQNKQAQQRWGRSPAHAGMHSSESPGMHSMPARPTNYSSLLGDQNEAAFEWVAVLTQLETLFSGRSIHSSCEQTIRACTSWVQVSRFSQQRLFLGCMYAYLSK